MKEFDIYLNRRATEYDILLSPTFNREEFITAARIRVDSVTTIDAAAALSCQARITPQDNNTMQISVEVTPAVGRRRRLNELDAYTLAEIDNMTLEELDYITL